MTTITKAAHQAINALQCARHGQCDQKMADDAIDALRAALQDKAGEVRGVLSDDDLDKIDMDAEAEANQNPEGDQRHWRKAYLRAFSRNLFAAKPAPVVPDDVARDAGWFRLIRDGGGWPAVFASHDAPEPLRGDDLDASMIAASQQKGGQHG